MHKLCLKICFQQTLQTWTATKKKNPYAIKKHNATPYLHNCIFVDYFKADKQGQLKLNALSTDSRVNGLYADIGLHFSVLSLFF